MGYTNIDRLRRFKVECKPRPSQATPGYHTFFAKDELDAWKKHVETFPDEEVVNVVEITGTPAFNSTRKWMRK